MALAETASASIAVKRILLIMGVLLPAKMKRAARLPSYC